MAVERAYGGTGLVDVLDRILDKGLVIDVWARVSLVGIELLTVEARVVVASVDTYLRYAQAIGLTPLSARPPMEKSQGLLGSGHDGQNGSPLQGLTDQLQGVLGQGQQGSQGGGLLQGVGQQLQGLTSQLQGGQGNGGQAGHGGQTPAALPSGLADQLRGILQQLESGEDNASRLPAGAGAGR